MCCLREFVLLEAPALQQMSCKPAQDVRPNIEYQGPPVRLEGLPQVSHELDTRSVAWLKFEAPADLQLINHLGQVVMLALFTHLFTAQQVMAINLSKVPVCSMPLLPAGSSPPSCFCLEPFVWAPPTMSIAKEESRPWSAVQS